MNLSDLIPRLNNISTVYSVNGILNQSFLKKYSKFTYILLISPVLLSNGFYCTGLVSNKYWKFLWKLCYPESFKDQQTEYTGTCVKYHPNEPKCEEAIKNNLTVSLPKILTMYNKLYFIHGLYLLFVKRISLKKVLKTELLNILSSSSFLFLQTLLQRVGICGIKNLNTVKFYLLSMICSTPILLERSNRVSQINNMMISNICVGYLNKFKKSKYIYIAICMVLLREKRIDLMRLISSVLNSER